LEFPEVTCLKCKKGTQDPKIDFEAYCIEGECPTGYNLLPLDVIELLEIRGVLVNLEPLGLAEQVNREYPLSRSDLEMLTFIEEELRELHREKKGNGGS
jgi:hypothetical protein